MAFGEDKVAAAWDANAATWAEHVCAGYDLYRELFTMPAFLAFAPDLGGLRVIDLGCGEGHNTRALARQDDWGRSVAADDRGRAREEAAAPLDIVYEVGSFTRLEFCNDGCFDAAVSTMALMDSPDFAAAARATHRVLRPGGGFWFSVLHPCFVTAGAKWLRDDRGRETHLTVADYFSSRPYVGRWRFSKAPQTSRAEPFQVPRFSRRLEDYVNGLCAASFRITRIAEPRPTAAQCAVHPWLARWRRHAGLVLLIAASKA
jgi:SAM-dependent methyltransferase